ncbi:MAG TPA: GNAT family N-acetyltransferase, partial [Pyrinomonadaceae bacterium]|nr:GNAT family N-acetyltransferase [Pyrinomonadaceae bacterium]
MIAYRLLSNDDFDSLHECFLLAFSDYEVDMRMSREQFRQRLTRDGVQLDLSAAAFDGDRMIAFCMNGFGEWQGKTTAYDGGTAVIPGYRGRGVAKAMMLFVEVELKEAGAVDYLLEVLPSNVAAATLYRKLGFINTRRLAVLRSSTRINRVTDIAIRRLDKPDWQLFRTFWDGYPSWQNSTDAVDRIPNDRDMVGAFVNDECVGYGVVFVPSGNLMQLAVAPNYRRRGIG